MAAFARISAALLLARAALGARDVSGAAGTLAVRNASRGSLLESTFMTDDGDVQARSKDVGRVTMDILHAVQYLFQHPVVKAATTVYYSHDAFWVEPKAVLDKARSQKDLLQHKLVLGDLVGTDMPEGTAHQHKAEMLDTLSFSQSSEAFTNAASREQRILQKVLHASNPPASERECLARFEAAEEALVKEVCDEICDNSAASAGGAVSPRNCSNLLLQGQQGRKALPDLSAFAEELCFNGDESTYQRRWAMLVGAANMGLEASLARKFMSPAALALTAQVALLQAVDMMVETCAKDSGWSNALGKTLHSIRNLWQKVGGEKIAASARDVVLAKSKQVREYFTVVTCPALQEALCQAGCDDGASCAGLTHGGSPRSTPFQRAHCEEMREFAEALKAVCEDSGSLAQDLPGIVLNYVADLSSLYGLTGLSALVILWFNPAMALNLNTVYAAVGALDSVAWLLRRLATGWKDASNACNEIARELLHARSPDAVEDDGEDEWHDAPAPPSFLELGTARRSNISRRLHSVGSSEQGVAARRYMCDVWHDAEEHLPRS